MTDTPDLPDLVSRAGRGLSAPGSELRTRLALLKAVGAAGTTDPDALTRDPTVRAAADDLIVALAHFLRRGMPSDPPPIPPPP